jgi:hypothetical protein
MSYTNYLSEISRSDVEVVVDKDLQYGSSWKRRGGVGAYMMLARKMDRIETALTPHPDDETRANGSTEFHRVAPWDIFGAIEADHRDEGILDDIRDLRRYLLLVEAEMRARETKKQSQATVPGSDRPFGYPGDG